MASQSNILSLPADILILLPRYLHNIEDYTNLSSTCRTMRDCMATATPSTILRLAAAQATTFFRPAPLFLAAATARELGHWARASQGNEMELRDKMKNGIDALMDLALEHCGLTMQRIRELHLMRFSVLNPVENIIDQCVGKQWQATPNFWDGGVDDAYTITAEPSETLFHLIIYGELFAPDLDAILDQEVQKPRLGVDTRLEFIKYCVPDFACHLSGSVGERPEEVPPRRMVKNTGPYSMISGRYEVWPKNNNLALTWVIRSSRWRPHWRAVRARAGPEFQPDFDAGASEVGGPDHDWRQKMWENVMMCQGLEGLEMIRDGMQDRWIPRIREWRDKIAALEREPPVTEIGRESTLEYPFLLGDLKCCVIGGIGGMWA